MRTKTMGAIILLLLTVGTNCLGNTVKIVGSDIKKIENHKKTEESTSEAIKEESSVVVLKLLNGP